MSVLYIPCQDSRSIIPEHMSVNKQRRATDGFERASNKNRSGYILTVTDTKRKHEERKEGSSTDPVRVAHACARLIHGRDTPHRGAHVGVPPHRPIHPPIFSHFPSYTRSRTGPSHAHTTRHVHTMLPRMHSQEGRAREGRGATERYIGAESVCSNSCTYTLTRGRV